MKFNIGFAIAFVLFSTIFSCKKDNGITDTAESSSKDTAEYIVYLKFNVETANQMDVSTVSTYRYTLTTTGTDPYVSLETFDEALSSEEPVFTFDYRCNSELSFFQFFFASPESEARSYKTSSVSEASDWTIYSIDMGEYMEGFDWGAIGEYLRFDFGDEADLIFQIRNMRFRSRTDEEEELAKAREDKETFNLLLESKLETYLAASYGSQITGVNVGSLTVTVTGNCSGDGNFSLCEIMSYDTLLITTDFQNATSLNSSSFSVDFKRYVNRDGFSYDRGLSEWIIVKDGTTDEIVSHAHYADQIEATENPSKQELLGRKGLGGFAVSRGYTTDLDDLQITSVTVNVAFTEFMYLNSTSNAIAHSYGGQTYYFGKDAVESLDATLQKAQEKNIVVSAIILIAPTSSCADPEIGALLQHPDFSYQGIFTMPNMTTPDGLNCYAAALDFLASRYCQSGGEHGRIHYWIMHNEVDAGLDWTNMGEDVPMAVYMCSYMKSMRLCHNITRQYDANSQVLASFTHSWTEACSSDSYPVKNMVDMLVDYSEAEGDFQWGLACHPYPEDLTDPKVWEDTKATYSMNSEYVTFKNLEVLDAWAKMSENKYQGTTKRTVFLSENGTNSPSYSDSDLKNQAAGLAYAWKKLEVLDGIDAMQWHNWIDNRTEYGLMIGLRRYPDDTEDPGGEKPVWYVYQAADTDDENSVFDQYKSIIGISDWDEVRYTGGF